MDCDASTDAIKISVGIERLLEKNKKYMCRIEKNSSHTLTSAFSF